MARLPVHMERMMVVAPLDIPTVVSTIVTKGESVTTWVGHRGWQILCTYWHCSMVDIANIRDSLSKKANIREKCINTRVGYIYKDHMGETYTFSPFCSRSSHIRSFLSRIRPS